MAEAIIATIFILLLVAHMLIFMWINEKDKVAKQIELDRTVTNYIESANKVNVLYKEYDDDIMSDVYKIVLTGIGLLAYVNLVEGGPSSSTICSYRFHSIENSDANIKLPGSMYDRLMSYVHECDM